MKRREFLEYSTIAGLSFVVLPKVGFTGGRDGSHSWSVGDSHLDFPVMTRDRDGNTWIAAVNRRKEKRHISVYMSNDDQLEERFALDIKEVTGIGEPAIAPFRDGCAIVFPYEKEERWHLGVSFLDERVSTPELRTIFCEGNANISPAIAAFGDKTCIVWESNAGDARGIYTCFADPDAISEAERISSGAFNSYNPAITADGDRIFCAFDSLRNKSADIYGIYYQDDAWGEEWKITSDVRIERHPYVTSHNNEIWMGWQAQSYGADEYKVQEDQPFVISPYKPVRLNNVDEQRIVVAKLKDGKLHAPLNFFREVSPKGDILLRPVIHFDSDGTLWLSARKSLGVRQGWDTVLWKYDNQWTIQNIGDQREGRWQQATIASTGKDILICSQSDNLPIAWVDKDHQDWESDVNLRNVPSGKSGKIGELKTEPLSFPKTDFSLPQKMGLVAADLKSKTFRVGDRKLNLYFGDLHEHSSISICRRQLNPPAQDLYANLRDIERLDFCAITDHCYNFDQYRWQLNGEQTRNNQDPGRFVTFLGQEWTSAKRNGNWGYGHHNLIFLDPYYKNFFNAWNGEENPGDVWEHLRDVEFICIPHQLADYMGKGSSLIDWGYTNEKYQPVAEIFQLRGSYEYQGCPRQSANATEMQYYYLQDTWARKTIIGTIASPDHGGGLGKAGVWAEKLDRQSIFDAIRARHTYGTSGAKMGLIFKSGDHLMGDKVANVNNGRIDFEINVWAGAPLDEIVLFRNNEALRTFRAHSPEEAISWSDENPLEEDFVWYYVRAKASDNEFAWSSPIWFLSEGV